MKGGNMKAQRITASIALLIVPLALAEAQGKLSIEVKPKALIYIDGKPIRNNSIKGMSVSPGNHRVKLESKEQGTTEFEMAVPADKHLKCEYNFENGENKCSLENLKAKPAPAAETLIP
jgi:hypothetical protein